MTGYLLPLTLDPWQVMTLDVVIDGEEFHAQVEIRYLPAPDQWVVSIWDHSSSELLVNMIPLVCCTERSTTCWCLSVSCGAGRAWEA